jgi:hypothetical protein
VKGDRAREVDESADSGFRTRTRIVHVLKGLREEYRLEDPVYVIGRAAGSDLRFTSALISRRHAKICVTSLGVTVEDLESRNGIFVNSLRVDGAMPLKPGDTLTVGDETFTLIDLEEPIESEPPPALTGVPAARAKLDSFTEEESATATRSANAFQLLGSVVEKSLALGRSDEAEHIIATHLQAALGDALASRTVPPDLARSAAGYAIKLAGATGRASWLDYAVELYSALGLTLPLSLVDEMYLLLRRVRGLDLENLRDYIERLQAQMQELNPAERFVLQRLVGLERLATWQATGGSGGV